MKAKNWLIGWLLFVIVGLGIIGLTVYRVDPYFHYHEPDLENYFYKLDNQRSQNDGISKHFDYDAIITGTSMTENFKTSEMNEIFGVNSIKVAFSGGSYKEIDDNLAVSLENNPEIKLIVRCLDYAKIFDDKDLMREDLGGYPTYLYDKNPLNDVKYIFNKDVIFGRIYEMSKAREQEGFAPGITSFDSYSRWQDNYTFGINTVIPDRFQACDKGEISHLTEDEKQTIRENIEQNVTSLADEYPDVKFYYFFSPYSVAWWKDRVDDGTINKWIEAETYIIETVLEHENIYLYSFNNCTDITTNLNHYKDPRHYGEWVNSAMLQWMYEGKYLLTQGNYQDYLNTELDFYNNFDYMSINDQEDYEYDYYAAALLNAQLSGSVPMSVLEDPAVTINLSNAQIVEGQYNGLQGIQCVGSLQRELGSEISVSDYILNGGYVGAKINIPDVGEHKYLAFYGRKIADNGQPSVFIYNENNDKVGELSLSYLDIDYEWHQYVLDLSKVEGAVSIVFNGGYIDKTGSAESSYVFSDIKLY